jgi:hypothetical protein
MSTNYSAWLVVGCPLDEFNVSMDEIDELGLDTFRPGNGSMLVGIGIFATPDYGFVDLPEKYKLDETISVAFAKFFTLTGKFGKLYLTVDVI